MGYPDRFGAAEVGVLVLNHGPDLKHVEEHRRTGLIGIRDGCIRPRRGRQGCIRSSERRQPEAVPIDVELVNGQSIEKKLGGDVQIGPAGRRRARLQTGVAGHDREVAARNVERNDLHGRASGVHLGLVERPGARGLECGAGAEGEHVGRHVETVRPDAELRIVVQRVVDLDGVEVPAAAHRIAGH